MANEYFLLFKTAQAEMRAWRNLNSPHKNNIIPIIELTRGRKIPRKGQRLLPEEQISTPGIFNDKKNIDSIQTDFEESRNVILDITREPSLISAELLEKKKPDRGYQSWHNFCDEIKEKNRFNLIPTLQVNPSETESTKDYIENLIKQFENFSHTYNGLAYRAAVVEDSDFLYDIALLKDSIGRYIGEGKRFIVILDHEFIRSGTGILHASRTITIIKKLRSLVPQVEIIILATSFPKSVTELGGQETGSFRLEEEYLYDEVKSQIQSDNIDLYYGDYGSINPIRNDNIGIIRGGWKPRIDFTAKDKRIFYYREKREEGSTYAEHYESVAKKVIDDGRFNDEDLQNTWGINQIRLAAEGRVPSSSPSFWIAVRMEIFLQRQIAKRFTS